MDEKRKEEETRELTPEEIDDMIFEEQIASEEHNEKVSEYYFSNPDPYAKIEPRPDDAPKRDIKFDENGNIVVKNLSAFWLPEVTIVDEVGGAEYTVTGSYEGTETLDKKLKRIMEQNATLPSMTTLTASTPTAQTATLLVSKTGSTSFLLRIQAERFVRCKKQRVSVAKD